MTMPRLTEKTSLHQQDADIGQEQINDIPKGNIEERADGNSQRSVTQREWIHAHLAEVQSIKHYDDDRCLCGDVLYSNICCAIVSTGGVESEFSRTLKCILRIL
jgi:hypothetical protein